jgi:hypothetical protein
MKTTSHISDPGLGSRSAQFLSTEQDSAPSNVGPWRGIFFDGPQADQDRDGEEIPAWSVYLGDQDAEPVSTVYTFHNFQSAEVLAKRMSHDRRLELVHEANPA